MSLITKIFGTRSQRELKSIDGIEQVTITTNGVMLEEQAKDLIRYISDSGASDEGIWETNIFGKTVEQLVYDGITGKLTVIGDESQLKLQETMQKIVNDSNGGMVCIII